MFVNGRQPNIVQWVHSQSEHTHTHFQALSSQTALLWGVFCIMTAMWFLLAAEIQSVQKVSHENSKILVCRCHGTKLEWFSTFTKPNFPLLTYYKTQHFSLASQEFENSGIFNIHNPVAGVWFVTSGFSYAFMSFIIHLYFPNTWNSLLLTSQLYAADLCLVSASVECWC